MLCFFVSLAQKNALHSYLPQSFNNVNTISQLTENPDVAIDQNNISLRCEETFSELVINFCNIGDAALTAPYYITIFKNEINGEILKIDTVNQHLSQNDCVEKTIILNTSTICYSTNLNYLAIVVNSVGNGIAQNGGLQEETDISNNIVIFTITHNSAQITGNHYICPDSNVGLSCSQAEAYIWSTNETTQSILVSEPAQYSVTAYYSEGCPAASNVFSVAQSENPILNVFLNDIFAGTTDTAVLGYLPTDNLVLASNIAQSQFNKVVFIPDGIPCDTLGCKYVATFSFAGYPEDAVINSVNDILYLRLNIEHSFIGDLFINFICPDEQNAYILKKGKVTNSECGDTIPSDGFGWHSGSNICNSGYNCRPYLGKANSFTATDKCNPSANGNEPGTGWNYCWSNNNNHNYQYNGYIYRNDNFQSYNLTTSPWTSYKIADSSDVSQGTNFYTPDQSFENLVGCHINGTWRVEVIDGFSFDNGYIFSCEVAIDENILSSQAPIVTSYSMDGLWLTQINDSTYTINPPANQKDTIVTYLFTVVGDNGCTYEASYDVNVYGAKQTDLYDTIKSSQLPYTWNDSTFYSAGNKTTELQTYYGADSIVTMHLSVIYQYDTTICENEFPYTWHGISFNTANNVEISQIVDAGSYNIFNLILETYPTNTISFTKTISSDSVPYEWHGQIFNDSEIKVLPLKNIYGCDSIVTLILKVNHDVYVSVDSFVCANNFPLTWNGKIFSEPETQIAYLTNNGADSIVTMNVFAHPLPDATILGDTVFCSDEDISIYANESKSYLWSTGDTSQTITISNTGLYSLTVTDFNNCTSSSSRQINKYFISPITKINSVEVCAGSSVPVIVGYDSIVSTFVISKGETTLSLSETIFLPDGQNCPPHGCSYRSPLTFTAFNDNETVQSVNDILYVKLNMEHSFAGDLYINITCPNNQKADILRFAGSLTSDCADNIPNSAHNWHTGQNLSIGTYFGIPIDSYYTSSNCDASASGNEPGTGWNYCWSNNTTEGYQYGSGNGNYIYRQGNGVEYDYYWYGWPYGYVYQYIFDSSNVANGTQFYHPDQSFQSLVGCPLNGSWYIEVMDGYRQDNGYIFGWELALAPHLQQSEYNDITHVTAEGPWISVTSDTSFVIQPPNSIKNDTTVKYIFHFYDDFGCSYDSVLYVKVFAADSSVKTVSACNSYTWQNQTYTQSGVYTKKIQTIHGCDSTLVLDLTISNSVTSTDSIFLVENQLPYYYSPANITFPVGSPAVSQITYTLPSSNNCDSTITLKVVIEYNSSQSFDTTICHYDFPLIWHEKTFNNKGIYKDSIINNNGATTYITYNIHTDSMSLVSSMVTHVTCFGDSTGAATINVINGQSPLSYKWTDSNNILISTTSNLQNVRAGTYKFVVTDELGCTATDSITINNINPLITQGTIAENRAVCIGQNIDIFNCNAANVLGIYQWQISSDGAIWNSAPGINNDTNYVYPNPVTDSFKLRRIFSHPACGTYFTDTVAISILPIIHFTIFDSVCQNQAYQLNGFNVPADSTYYSIDTLIFSKTYSTQNCDSIVTLKLKVKAPLFTTIFDSVCLNQPYQLNGFNVPSDSTASIDTLTFSKTYATQNCDSTVTLKLIIIAPKYTTISDFVCQNQPYQLNGFNIPADSTTTIDILTFSKTFSTANCDSIVTLKLSVVAPTVNIIEDFVCKGNPYNSHGFNIVADSLFDKSSYEKSLLLQNSYGCDSLVNLKLTIIDTFLKLTNLTTDFCETFSAELQAETPMEHILWSTNEQTNNIIVTRPATYFVTATEKNCINSKSITIEPCPWNMYLPNAINPYSSADKNNFFALSESLKQEIDGFEITIYNRWGTVVFHSYDKDFIWEGKIDGKIMHNSVYTYVIYCTKHNGKKLIFKGNITVL